ncbi:DUF58 domain-containing protein [Babesia caballi]|uniref:DUF58 domain-containing protein n=1 Tax=Babesia caballi TaxID=5871 RepID=A0AAV4LSU6_BABCB|nr:DUF58 domain-containing protein [Babesia caballi]
MTANNEKSGPEGEKRDDDRRQLPSLGLVHFTSNGRLNPREVDLESLRMHARLPLFRGTFSNGGIYFFTMSSRSAFRVTYGTTELVPRCLRRSPYRRVYVEYFLRGEERVIRVIAFNRRRGRCRSCRVVTFLVDCRGPVECTHHAVRWITGGPVRLDVDLNPGAKIHPFLNRTTVKSGDRETELFAPLWRHRGYAIHQGTCCLTNPYQLGTIWCGLVGSDDVSYGHLPITANSHIVRIIHIGNVVEVCILRPDSLELHRFVVTEHDQ